MNNLYYYYYYYIIIIIINFANCFRNHVYTVIWMQCAVRKKSSLSVKYKLDQMLVIFKTHDFQCHFNFSSTFITIRVFMSCINVTLARAIKFYPSQCTDQFLWISSYRSDKRPVTGLVYTSHWFPQKKHGALWEGNYCNIKIICAFHSMRR